jgi:hypothetical protein
MFSVGWTRSTTAEFMCQVPVITAHFRCLIKTELLLLANDLPPLTHIRIRLAARITRLALQYYYLLFPEQWRLMLPRSRCEAR